MRTKSKVVFQKPPADFEEVKRNFLRQNRALAKNNSTQSLRIRSLELELSRLQADNLELRNQVLNLQHEVYTAQSQASTAAVRQIKEELQAKITELSGLVNGIEDVQQSARPPTEKKPLEGIWRERQPLAELMRESQMPTITEDKLFPRRTLGADEIQAIRLSDHSSNESPDLGPPPIAHFDCEDPVKHASPLVNKTSSESSTTGEDDVLPASLSVNLETRRKRKDGQPRLEIRRHSILPQSPVKADGEQSAILRTGAKRKLADRESEKPSKPPSKDDFIFSRKSAVDASKPSTGDATQQKTVKADQHEAPTAMSPKPVRKVLGDKSVNMSPRKAISQTEKPEKQVASRFTSGKDAASARRRRASSIPLPSPPRDSIEAVEIEVPELDRSLDVRPKTPAAPDIFSPTPSEPSARPEGRGDTPPPGDLSTLSMTTDGGTRPSRRARAAVNYAEPSLNAKMRRPDKKMVDALSGLQDHRRAMSGSEDRKGSRSVTIKKEAEEDEAWKDLPLATNVEPLSPSAQEKGADASNHAPVENEVDPPERAFNPQPSATSATIAALMAGSRKRRQSSQQPLGTDIDAAAKRLEELDLYDFKESSSPLTDSSEGKAGTVPFRSHRRHSSMPKDISPADNGSAPSVVQGVGSGRSERAASRRRSMMV